MPPIVPDGEYDLDMSMLLSASCFQGLTLEFPRGTMTTSDESVKVDISGDDVQIKVNDISKVYEGKLDGGSGTSKLVSVFDPVKRRFLLERVQDVKLMKGSNDKSINNCKSTKLRGDTQWLKKLIDKVKGDAPDPRGSMTPTKIEKLRKDTGNGDISLAINTLSVSKKRRTNIGSPITSSPMMSPSMNPPSRPHSMSMRNTSPSRTISPVRLPSPLRVKRSSSDINEFGDDRVCKSPVVDSTVIGKNKGTSNSTLNKPTSAPVKKSSSLLQKARRVHSRNQAQIKSTSKLEVSTPIKESAEEIKKAFTKLERTTQVQSPRQILSGKPKPQGLGVHRPNPIVVKYDEISLTPPIGSPLTFEEVKIKPTSLHETGHKISGKRLPALPVHEPVSQPSPPLSNAPLAKSNSEDIEFDMDDIDWADTEAVETGASEIGKITIEEHQPVSFVTPNRIIPVAVSSVTNERVVNTGIANESCDSIDQLVDELAEIEDTEPNGQVSDMSEEE